MKQRWKELVYYAALPCRPSSPISRADVSIIYHFPDKRRRDPDNYNGKMILDGLTESGVIKDDSFGCIDLHLSAKFKDGNYTEIIITEV